MSYELDETGIENPIERALQRAAAIFGPPLDDDLESGDFGGDSMI